MVNPAGFALAAGRRLAEQMMVDTCVITRPGGGEPTYNPSTRTYTYPTGSAVYDGPCRIQVQDSLMETTVTAGEATVTHQTTMLSVPLSAIGVEVNDIVLITDVDATSDLDLVGKRFRVASSFAKTNATARRVQCEEVTGT